MTTTTTPSADLVFYDIAMRPPTTETCCAPNPWKSRYALNFKKVPYTTTWVQLPDIKKVRSGLGVPAMRSFADGTDFYTLPMLSDPAHNAIIADSFDIAIHLQKTYPNSGSGDLLPPQKLDYTFPGDLTMLVPLSERNDKEFKEYALFNTHVDAAFTSHSMLMGHGLPFDPATEAVAKAETLRRASMKSWDDLLVTGEAREKIKKSFCDTLSGLAELFKRDHSGPFMLGTRASYADFIVGGWLRMMQVTLPAADWEEARAWHDGTFGKLHDALQVYAECSFVDIDPLQMHLLFLIDTPMTTASTPSAMAITSTPSADLVFYDIAMRPPIAATCCATNPWKSRYALNFKKVPYSTTWVQMPDITKVRSGLGVSAARKFADGSDYHTLPVLSDPAHNALIGDSFDIAVYLQKTYPDSGSGDLFPPQTLDYVFSHDLALLAPLSERNHSELAEYSLFNTNVDAAFSAHVMLMIHGLPFDLATEEQTRAEFIRRSNVASWDDLTVRGEEREKLKRSFCDMLGGLAELFKRDPSGPFMLGTQASYADLIVGGWLRMMQVTLPTAEWEEARTWHDGIFGRLYDALQVYAEVK
ncbi:hypothetical protein EC991_008996 [Linnemannia zychae]|nr:hypothetical protein EC991_008996 [Linnemannia zychae]